MAKQTAAAPPMKPKYVFHIVVEHGHLAPQKMRKQHFDNQNKNILLSMRLPRLDTTETMYRQQSVKDMPTFFILAV